MRNPTIHYFFGASLDNGLSEILAGFESDIPYCATDFSDLVYLSAGKIPPNPAELLAGNKLDKLIETAQEQFDYIFIDSPPVCVVTDASILAKKITGCIFVIREGKSDMYAVRHAVSTIENVGGNIVGFILNCVNPKRQSIYKNYERKYNHYDYDRTVSK
jgi:capsular exopolysaccharide synthesis family protein